MVETYPQPFGVSRFHDLLHQVALQDGSGVIVTDLRIMQGKAVVMLRGENDVPAARLFGQSSPFAGETGFRPEERDGALRIGGRIRLDALLNPFHAA